MICDSCGNKPICKYVAHAEKCDKDLKDVVKTTEVFYIRCSFWRSKSDIPVYRSEESK